MSRCRARRQRAAPSASRTASSRCLVVDRASTRLVRFAQAMSSTKRNGAEQNHRRRPDVLQQRRRPRRGREPPALVLLERPGLRLLDASRDRRELGVGLHRARPWRQPREHCELTHVARNPRRIAAPRNPEIGADEQQPRRHDPDDRAGRAADANRPIQDCRIAGKAALPETVTDDRDRRAVWPRAPRA